jgi:hypothetical protein
MKPIATLSVLAAAALTIGGLQATPARQDPDIEPEAHALVRSMCEYLTGLKNFSLEADDTTDHVLDSGQKIQYAMHRSLTVSRPSRVRADAKGDLADRTVWKDGATFAMANHDDRVFGLVDVPESIDATMDFLSQRYAMELPLADLLSEDPWAIFNARVTGGFVVGPSRVEGHECTHLAFTQENVDWEIWIDSGEVPAPRKLVITYKGMPSFPQYQVVLHELKALQSVDTATFRFEAPDGYEKIDVLPVEEEG